MTGRTEAFMMLIISCCSGFFATNAVSRFLHPIDNKLLKVVIYFVFCITMANKSWIGDENPLLLFPFFMACFLLCYEGPKLARIVMGMIFFSLIEPTCMMIDSMEFPMLNHFPVMFQINLALIKLLLWFFIWLLLRYTIPKKDIYPLPKNFWFLLGALSLAPLFSTLSFSIWEASSVGHDVYNAIVPRIAYTTLPFTVITALALLVAVVVLSRHERLKEQQKLADMQEVYYQSIKRELVGIRSFRHDLHNHIAVTQGLLERGDIAGTKQYLDAISCSPAMSGKTRYCENDIADAVISSKIALMNQYAIVSDVKVSIPQDIPFPDIDLCALFGNALDNAIEAASQATEKSITLRARADKGMLMLRVDNTLKQAPRLVNGRLATTKSDTAAHGQGFAVMMEIAKRHGGKCEAEYSDASFTLIISIPLL